jgi:hypothetical protein
VERWLGNHKSDLYGCIDIVALKGNITLAIQVTAGSAHAARVTKVKEAQYLPLMLEAGWVVEVWSYRKSARTGRYVRRIEQIGYEEEPGTLKRSEGADSNESAHQTFE